MKTFTKALAAAVTLVGSAVTANAAGPVNFGYGASGYHSNCSVGCRCDDCGLTGHTAADHYRSTSHSALRPAIGRSASNGFYDDYRRDDHKVYGQGWPNSPSSYGVNRPQGPVPHTANYPSSIRAGGCTTGNCPQVPMTRPQNTWTPISSFLGMRF